MPDEKPVGRSVTIGGSLSGGLIVTGDGNHITFVAGDHAGPAPSSRGPWRVFLSHTSELAQHPDQLSFVAAAKQAIERAGHVAVEMATMTASALPSAQVCAEQVAGCDVYVALVGGANALRAEAEETFDATAA